MNLIPTADHRPPPQPHCPSFNCDLHPDEKFNGFCPSCLCDRLSTLHPATSSLFRRTKSFSASKQDNLAVSSFEPQRRSCDVGVRVPVGAAQSSVDVKIRAFNEQIRARFEKIGPIEEKSRVKDLTDAGRAQTLTHNVGDEIRAFEDPISSTEGEANIRVPIKNGKARTLGHNLGDEIRVFEDSISPIKIESRVRVSSEAGRAEILSNNVGDEARVFEQVIAVEEEMKRMKDYLELDFQAKKKKPPTGFWSTASAFSKKWNKWMKKQKAKKHSSSMEKTVLPLEKPIPHKYRNAQSEVADYGFGRRSCDTDPRFSIDIGRLSIDGPRPSFDLPRVSWDGHMMRRSNFSDRRVPIIDPIPGDSAQTHQYYVDTSSRRRRSFDRSGSKRGSLVNGSEVDDTMVGANAKVTPETFDFHQRKSNSNSLRDECSEIFELGIRDDGSVIGNVEEKGTKKSWRWGKKWSFWGLINGRNNKHDEDDRYSRSGFDRSSSVRGNDGNMYRTSSVSLINSNINGGLGGHARNQSIGENGYGRNKKDGFVLERNRSVDNGLMRFYLTPPRSNNRVVGSRKSHLINRGVYRY